MWNMTPADTFECKGRPVSFMDHAKTKHQCPHVIHQEQPMLKVVWEDGPDKRRHRLHTQNPPDTSVPPPEYMYLIPQVTFSCGLTDAQRTNNSVMRSVASIGGRDPSQKFAKIDKFYNELPRDDLKKKYGIDVKVEPVKTTGRVLPNPQLVLDTSGDPAGAQRTTTADGDGGWRSAVRDVHSSAELTTWMLIVSRSCRFLDDFIRCAFDICDPSGQRVCRSFARPLCMQVSPGANEHEWFEGKCWHPYASILRWNIA